MTDREPETELAALGPDEEESIRALIAWPGPAWSGVRSTVLLDYMRHLVAEIDRLRAATPLPVEGLREAVLAAEWRDRPNVPEGIGRCPNCGAHKVYGHYPECWVAELAALAATNPSPEWTCDWTSDDLNPSPECPYCAGRVCARFDGLGCTHDRIERHGYVLPGYHGDDRP